jgi:MYXO-CTERM domain-containing protein
VSAPPTRTAGPARALRAPTSIVVLSLALTAAVARGDVVDREPESCPAGATPATAHSGPYCRANPLCATDADCGASGSCEEVAQCIEPRACGGLMPPDAAACTVSHVAALCEGGGACASGSCETRRVCIAPGATSSGGGCSCGVGRATDAVPIGIALVAVGAMIASRRRSRSARAMRG